MLEQEFNELETYLSQLEKSNPQVSKAAINWHCDHILRATLGICMACIRSDANDYKPNFNLQSGWF